MKTSDPGKQLRDDGIIFAWKVKQRSVLHMTVFLIVSVMLHISGFYLFQVVYPSAGRVEPVPDRLIILDNNDPAVRDLMSKVEDRVVFLRPPSENSSVRKSLDDYKIQFKPLFTDREPNVKLKFPAQALGLSSASEAESEKSKTSSTPNEETVPE